MSWFNYYGLIAVVIILIPNIISAIFNKGVYGGMYSGKAMTILEQIGRYGCMIFMVFNIPWLCFNFRFNSALSVYLIVNGTLLVLYLLGWVVFDKGRSAVKMLTLSIIPTAIFLFSGIMLLSIPLIIAAVLFGIGHITISCKNIE